jgi:hypothetical protein
MSCSDSVGLILPRITSWRGRGRDPTDTEGGTWTWGGKKLGRRIFNRNIKETAAICKVKYDILGSATAVGKAKLAGDTVEVGNGGMAGAVEGFAPRVRGEDSGLERRSMPEREEKGTLIGVD